MLQPLSPVVKPTIIEKLGPPLTLEYRPLGGPSAEVDARAFAEYLAESIFALSQTAISLTNRSVILRYNITGLQKQDSQTHIRAVVELTPVVALLDVPVIDRTQKVYVETIRELQEGVVRQELDFAALQTFRRLGTIAKKNNFTANVRANGSSVETGANLKDRLDLELAKDQWAEGTMRGYIRSYYAVGSKRLIRLYPRVGKPITCQFQRRDQEKVLALIDRFVEIQGNFRYRPNAYHPYHGQILEISAIDVDDAPTFASMEGFAPGLGARVAAEDLVREMRNDW